jgi:hypothetical protein
MVESLIVDLLVKIGTGLASIRLLPYYRVSRGTPGGQFISPRSLYVYAMLCYAIAVSI